MIGLLYLANSDLLTLGHWACQVDSKVSFELLLGCRCRQCCSDSRRDEAPRAGSGAIGEWGGRRQWRERRLVGAVNEPCRVILTLSVTLELVPQPYILRFSSFLVSLAVSQL